jgi:polysaccharide biosynthesis protein PslG
MTRRWTLALLACALLGGAAPARAALPPDFFGIVSEDGFAGKPSYRNATMARQAASGIGLIRQTFHWNQIERRPGRYNFSYYDRYVGAAAAHGIRILPILFDPPRFRARTPRHSNAVYPPRRYSTLGAFGAAVARRYGPAGTFWARHPTLPKIPITAYQIWNEPNLPVYWASGPNPTQYARLLRVARAGIRRVDPQAEIVTAGLPDSHLSRPGNVYSFVAAMMRAGAGRGFDTLAVNPYGRNTSQLMAKVRRFRSILDRAHDGGAAIRVTEFGWSDSGPYSGFRAGVRGQARLISTTVPALARAAGALRIRGIVYYDWRDSRPYPPRYRDFWGLHTGLLRRNGRAKPALAAFQAAVARSR